MTDFYEDLRLKYDPDMTPLEFSNVINVFENELFDVAEELLQLDENTQNAVIEFSYRQRKRND